jgi:hypothetical protein
MEGSTIRGPYVYGSTDNKLQYISGHPTKGNTNGNFEYDLNGNMILDRSKKMAVVYDANNMPVMFRFFTSLPPDPIPLDQILFPAGAGVVADVTVGYDANGNRAFKQTYKY